MFALASLWLSAIASLPAEAAAELQFRSTSPVLFYVDGQPAAMMGNLKMRAKDLAAGPHEVRVTGIFGKVLYEGEIDLPDGMITHTEWVGKQLAVVRTEALREEPAAEGGPWEEPTDEEEEEPVLAADEPAPVVPLEVESPEPTPAPALPRVAVVPVDEPAVAAEPAPLAVPVAAAQVDPIPSAAEPAHAMVLPLAAPAAPPSRSTGSVVRVTAQEGMTLELALADQVVRVTVRDGAFVIEDAGGVSITLGHPSPAAAAPALVRQEPGEPSDG